MVIWIKDSGTGRGIWVSNHHLRDSGFSFVLLLLPCPSLALGPLLTLILWSLRPLASWFIMDSLCQRIIEIPLVLFLPLRASWSKAWSSISWWFFSSSLQFTCGLRNSHVSSIVVRRRTRQGTTVLDCLRVWRRWLRQWWSFSHQQRQRHHLHHHLCSCLLLHGHCQDLCFLLGSDFILVLQPVMIRLMMIATMITLAIQIQNMTVLTSDDLCLQCIAIQWLGEPQNKFSVKVGNLAQGGEGGSDPIPTFFQNWPKPNLPWNCP